MSKMGEYQTKESPGRMIWEHYTTIIPKKLDSSTEKEMSSLPESEWAESQKGITQDIAKNVFQSATPWKTSIFLRRRVELFTGGWVDCCWIPKRVNAGWSENWMPSCNALKNGHLREWKGWAPYRRVIKLLLSLKEGWRRMKWKLYIKVQLPEKRVSSWKEGLSSLPEGNDAWLPDETNNYQTDEGNRKGK